MAQLGISFLPVKIIQYLRRQTDWKQTVRVIMVSFKSSGRHFQAPLRAGRKGRARSGEPPRDALIHRAQRCRAHLWEGEGWAMHSFLVSGCPGSTPTPREPPELGCPRADGSRPRGTSSSSHAKEAAQPQRRGGWLRAGTRMDTDADLAQDEPVIIIIIPCPCPPHPNHSHRPSLCKKTAAHAK